MNFSDIPNELILLMCEFWDTPTLLNMSQAYSRIYQICSDVAKDRYKIYRCEKLTLKILNTSVGAFQFKKITDGTKIQVSLSRALNSIYVNQTINDNLRMTNIFDISNVNRLRKITKDLIDREFSMIYQRYSD